MRETVEAAIPVFVRHAKSDDRTLAAALAARCDIPTASCLVEFMPIAFARVMLGDSGVSFSRSYVRLVPGGKPSAERPLADEPIFAAAAEVARSGVGREEMLAIACRSAEFHAINAALHAGSKLENLVLSPPVLTRSEPATIHRKHWWQLWRSDA